MPNSYVNKVVYGNSTLIDLTADTVTPATLMQGYTAHDASGALITGTATESDPAIWQDANGYVHVSDTAEVVEVYADDDGYVVLDIESEGGLDLPVFEPIPNTMSATCNKTYSECLELYLNGIDAAYVEMYNEGALAFSAPLEAYQSDSNGITYVMFDHGVPAGSLIYYISGYIELFDDIPTVDTLTVTRNATYSGGLWNEVEVDVALQSKTVTPTETLQTITPDADFYDGLSQVTVNGISSTYVGSGITRRSSSDLTASGATVTVPSGYYASQASASVASGTAGTPTATKGAVSNHAVSVTPSVTNTTGYITGGTKTGTAVSVSASELVSGTLNVSSNGTVDVTNYASASVNIQGGGSNDFVVTLTYNSTTEMWEPDCTYAEVSAAYTAGKTIVVDAAGSSVDATADGEWDEYGHHLEYWVHQYYEGAASSIIETQYRLTSNGLIVQGTTSYVVPSGSTSITQNGTYDVTNYASASVSVQGGDDSNYAHTISRSGAITSIPSGITSIGGYAFRGCTGLSLSSLPSGVTSIGTYAFYGCTGLTVSSLPSGVTSIGSYAFRDCSGMPLSSLPSGVASIDTYTFYGCDLLTVSTLPDGLTYIGSNSFQNCPSMTSIQGSGRITTIGSSAFLGSSSKPSALVSAKFPNANISGSLSTAFGSTTAANACQQLEEADLGSVASIAANAFANCCKLDTLVLRRTANATGLSNVSAFLNTPFSGYNGLTGTVYVPSSLIDSYKTASNWSTLYNDGTLAFAAIEGSEWEL